MEDEKCHVQTVLAVKVSAAALCAVVVLKYLRGTPELFSI